MHSLGQPASYTTLLCNVSTLLCAELTFYLLNVCAAGVLPFASVLCTHCAAATLGEAAFATLPPVDSGAATSGATSSRAAIARDAGEAASAQVRPTSHKQHLVGRKLLSQGLDFMHDTLPTV